MRYLARERLSVHKGATSNVIKYIGFFFSGSHSNC